MYFDDDRHHDQYYPGPNITFRRKRKNPVTSYYADLNRVGKQESFV